ncbi:mevalonate kinase-like [Nylanderia fulva]|uniref:mevalonate kinase-like n=1 Tax=Nylanderia fulva TaxID=613905 RepID=UPI0010FB169E|nr:mevalonate kinase-like [Nylanderia fulva]
MINFKISAPGRIVLSGEYGAIYGKHVVLASLNRYTKLEFQELPVETKNIIIKFPGVKLSLKVFLVVINEFMSAENFQDMIKNHFRFSKLLQSLITLNNMWITNEQKFSLKMFFFLLMHIANDEKLDIKSFRVHVSTDLMIGAGLGSSSSFAVCLSACFLHWARLQKGAHSEFNREDLISISKYAKLSEKVLQSCKFETDNDVCCYGNIIEFRYINQEDNYPTGIIDTPAINIMLVDLKFPFVMGERARLIAEKKHFDPETVNIILTICDGISDSICRALKDIKYFSDDPDLFQTEQERAYVTLQMFVRLHQHVLSELLHPMLKRMSSIALDCVEISLGKFAGYEGNFAYILLPPNLLLEEQTTNLITRLKREGFDVTMTSVSCNGVTID